MNVRLVRSTLAHERLFSLIKERCEPASEATTQGDKALASQTQHKELAQQACFTSSAGFARLVSLARRTQQNTQPRRVCEHKAGAVSPEQPALAQQKDDELRSICEAGRACEDNAAKQACFASVRGSARFVSTLRAL